METDTAGAREPSRGWAVMASWAAVTLIVIFVIIQAVVAKVVIPPLLVFCVLFAVAIVVTGAKPRAGAIAIGVLGLLAILGNLPPIIEDTQHPDSTVTFILTAVAVVAALAAVVAAVASVARSRGGARPAGLLFLSAAVITIVVGVIAGMSAEDEEVAEGDFEVVAKDTKFQPALIEAEAGDVSVHVDNKDLSRHTFAIEDLDVEEELTAGKGTRIELGELEAGSYDFRCTVPEHDDMTGLLVVE